MGYVQTAIAASITFSPIGFDPQGKPVTVSQWVYLLELPTGADAPLFSVASSETASIWMGITAGGVVAFVEGFDTTNLEWHSVASAIGTNAWHHLAATYDGSGQASGVTMFVDGVEVSEGSSQDGATEADPGDSDWFVRNGGVDRYVGGAALWNRILSDDEIAALAAGFSARCMPNALKWAPPLLCNTLDPVSGVSGNLVSTSYVEQYPAVLHPASGLAGRGEAAYGTAKVPWHLLVGSAL